LGQRAEADPASRNLNTLADLLLLDGGMLVMLEGAVICAGAGRLGQ